MRAAERRRLAYLEAMGIQTWMPRLRPPCGGSESGEDGRSFQVAAGAEFLGASKTTANDLATLWEELQAEVIACKACRLHENRTQAVFDVGDRAANWMVIGEAPGEQEDLQGEPFVGRAGLLLNEMLRAVGLRRDQVYIANIVKCRPPKNRDPQVDEAAACEGFLKRQVALVRPQIILAVGRIAAQNLLKTTAPIGKLRGVIHDYEQIPLVVTYHPAYLLRAPLEKRKAWDDLRLALHAFSKSV